MPDASLPKVPYTAAEGTLRVDMFFISTNSRPSSLARDTNSSLSIKYSKLSPRNEK